MSIKPNFIIIMTDQQRADHLGCYGNDIVQTPNIDAIAARGTRFTNFYTATPICQPNRAALMTGQMTSVNGCRQNGIPIDKESTTYADVLRAAGYRTGIVGKAHFQNVSDIPAKPRQNKGDGDTPQDPWHTAKQTQRTGPAYQQEQRTAWTKNPDRALPTPYYGFDYTRLCIGHGDQVEGHYSAWLRDNLNGGPDPRGRPNAISDNEDPQIWRTAVPEELYPTTFVGNEACVFLEEDDDSPFLLVASFPDPHHPFTPPGKYFDMYDPADIPLPASFTHPTNARTDLPDSVQQAYRAGDESPDAYWPFHTTPEMTRKMIALNYGAITMIDNWIGTLMQTLQDSGKADNTIICFMSDHGDYMGDHGTVLKHGLHSHGVINVPMIWADPRANTAKTTDIHASAIDFAPMLLQTAGIKCPIGMQGQNPLATNAKDSPVLIEDPGMGVYSDPDANTSMRTIVFKGWRMTVFEGSDLGELYDLNADPHELTNLWADPNATAQKMRMMQHLVARQIALRDTSLLATNQA